jgi:hypothetical protein
MMPRQPADLSLNEKSWYFAEISGLAPTIGGKRIHGLEKSGERGLSRSTLTIYLLSNRTLIRGDLFSLGYTIARGCVTK